MTRGSEAERRTAALERQNDVLREQVEYWKSQLKRSDPAGRADPTAVRKTARELIRDASDGKKYLYDLVNIKENAPDTIDLTERETRSATASAAAPRGNASIDKVAETPPPVKRDRGGKKAGGERLPLFVL